MAWALRFEAPPWYAGRIGRYREPLLALLAATLLSMALWPGAWFAGKSIYSTDAVLTVEPWRSEAGLAEGRPYNGELGDHDFYIFPQLAFVQRHLHEHGELPLWNPATYAGVPLDGNPQVALLYPFHLLLPLFQERGAPFSLWRLSRGLTWMGILRFVLCAAFAYLWLRRLGGRWWNAGLFAAVVAGGSYASLWRLHTPEQVFSLVPAALFFLEGMLQGRGRRQLVGFALAFGFSTLGGYPQTSLFFAIFFVAYALLRPPPEGRAAGLRRLLVGGVLAGLIAMPMAGPFLTYLAESGLREIKAALPIKPERVSWGAVIGYGSAALACLALAWRIGTGTFVRAATAGGVAAVAFALAALGGGDGQQAHWLVAGATGHPLGATAFTGVFGERSFIETNQDHVGLLVAVLLVGGTGSVVRRLWWLLVGVLLVASAFPLVYEGMRAALPLVWPSRATCLVPLCVAMLGVAAVESLLRADTEERADRLRAGAVFVLAFRVLAFAFVRLALDGAAFDAVAIASAVVALALLFLPLRHRLVTPAVALVAAVAALLPGYGFQPALGEREVYPETPTVRFLRAASERDPDLRVFTPDPGVFDGNTLLALGMQQSLGADGMDPKGYLLLVLSMNYPEAVPLLRSEWSAAKLRLDRPPFDVLGARFVVAREGATLPPHFRAVHEGEGVVVAENPRAAPRAYLTARATTDATELLGRPVTEHVVLDARDGPVVLDGTPMSSGTARIAGRRAGELLVDTDTDGAAWLVVLDGRLRGWRATVDGAPAAIRTAFGAFRSVQVPAGRHRVRFVYRPPAYAIGFWAAVAALLVLAGLLVSSAVGGRGPAARDS